MTVLRVTVAVVSWNTRDLLASCLDSLAPSVEDGRARVVVVDNGSTDGSAELVASEYGWAELRTPGRNTGFGGGVNVGLEGAETQWVAAANADIEVPADSLRHLLDVGESRPGCAAVAPRLELPDGSTQRSVFTFPRLRTALLAGLGVHRLSPRISTAMFHGPVRDWKEEVEVEWAMGAFLLIRRDAFAAVGGFDERQWMYAEDLDLCWRLAAAGGRIVYAPAATVRHVGGAATSEAFGDVTGTVPVLAAHYGWLRRRRGRIVAALFGAWATLTAAARVAIYALGALLRIPGAAARRERAAAWLGRTREAIAYDDALSKR